MLQSWYNVFEVIMMNGEFSNFFVITKASLEKDADRKRYRVEIIKKLEKEAKESLGMGVFFGFANVLVLWEDFQKEKFIKDVLGYSKRDIIERFCERIRDYKEDSIILIESPAVLGTSMAEVLEILNLIWERSGKIPYFIDNNFLDVDGSVCKGIKDISSRYSEEIERKANLKMAHLSPKLKAIAPDVSVDTFEKSYFKNKQSEIIASLNKSFANYFEKFFASISNLLSLFNAKTDGEKGKFIDLYISWQLGEKSVEECCKEYDEVERQTWYRHSDIFEKSPIYEEIINIYKDSIQYTKKRGRVPDTFEILGFLKDQSSKDFPKPISTLGSMDCYFHFENIYAYEDVHRCAWTALERINILKHKGKYYSKLEELGIEDVSKYFKL